MLNDRLAIALRRYRLDAELTQERLAEKSGVSIRTIRGIETGKRPNPQVTSIRQLADALALTGDDREELVAAALGQSTTAGTVSSLAVPRQLPAAPRLFTGRADEFAALTRSLDDAGDHSGSAVVAAVTGAGGIGKTALALHWAHRHVDRFPDGQLYVNLRGFDPAAEPTTPGQALRGLLAGLGAAPRSIPADLDAASGLYRSLLAGKRLIIVLDNARDGDQVQPLLPGGSTCLTLVTSRRRLTGLAVGGAQLLDLDVLADNDARQLLAAHLGEQRLAEEPEAVAEILARCAGLPLALSILAARAASHPSRQLAVLAAELQDTATRLDALDASEVAATLRTVFDSSYHALDPDAATLFCLLGLVPGPDISLDAASCLSTKPARTRTALNRLESAHLVQQHTLGRYRMHDLVHVYSAEQARAELRQSDRDAALRRLVAFYLHTAHAGESLIDTPRAPIELPLSQEDCRPEVLRDRATAWAWYDREHPCLVSVQQLAMELGWYREAWQLACVTFRYHVGRGRLRDIVTMWQRGLVAARNLADPVAQSRAHRALAEALTKLGDHDAAIGHLGEAMALAESTGDAAAVTRTHHVLARVWGDGRADYRRACDHIGYVLRHCHTLDNHHSQIDVRCDAAWFLAKFGEYEQARAHAIAALALYREVGDVRSEACALDTLGFIAYRTGQNVLAIEYYGRALQLRRGDNFYEPNSREHLGDFYASLGRLCDAREMWTGALDLYRTQQRATNVENVRQKLSALGNCGS